MAKRGIGQIVTDLEQQLNSDFNALIGLAVEGLSSENTIKLCEWLKNDKPDVIIAEEMQDNFGGTKSFDWAIKDKSGTTGSVPGFQTFNTTKEQK